MIQFLISCLLNKGTVRMAIPEFHNFLLFQIRFDKERFGIELSSCIPFIKILIEH